MSKLINQLLKIVKSFEYLGCKFPLWRKLYYNIFYKKMIAKELELANLKKKAKILHIGSGPLPMTACFLSSEGHQVVAVDNDLNALNEGKAFCRKCNIQNEVKFRLTEGKDTGCRDFDAIWISLHVEPKRKTLNEIYSKLKRGSKIIYRNPRGFLKRFYPYFPPEEITYDNKKIKQFFGKESVILRK